MSRPRITITIDRIVTDRPGLDRGALETALYGAVQGLVTERGTGALGPGRNLESVRGRVANRDAASIAGATIKAVTS